MSNRLIKQLTPVADGPKVSICLRNTKSPARPILRDLFPVINPRSSEIKKNKQRK